MDIDALGLFMLLVIVASTIGMLVHFWNEDMPIGWSIMTVGVGLACVGLIFTGTAEYKKKNDVYPCKVEEVQ